MSLPSVILSRVAYCELFFQPSFNLYVTPDDTMVYKPPPEVPKVGWWDKPSNIKMSHFMFPQKEEKKKEEKKIAPIARWKIGTGPFFENFTQNGFRAKKKVTAVVPPNPERKKWVFKKICWKRETFCIPNDFSRPPAEKPKPEPKPKAVEEEKPKKPEPKQKPEPKKPQASPKKK